MGVGDYGYAEIAVFVETVRDDLDSHFVICDESAAGEDECEENRQSGTAKSKRTAFPGRRRKMMRNNHI